MSKAYDESQLIENIQQALMKLAMIANQQNEAVKANFVSQDDLKKSFNLGIKHGLDAALAIISSETGMGFKVEDVDDRQLANEAPTLPTHISTTLH